VIAPLPAFLLRRLALALLFVLTVSTSALILARLAPGDATTHLLLTESDPAAVAAARERLGLEGPIAASVGRWLGGLARFDLGDSSRFGRPVAELVGERLRNTALLAGVALALATAFGLPLGTIAGTRPRTLSSKLIAWTSLLLVSCPPIIATLALLLLGASTGWLSVQPGRLALPALALALPVMAMLERLQAQAAAEAVRSPDLTAAAARDVTRARLIWLHAGRQSLRPVLGVYGLVMATLFSGSIAVETITAWPGLGRLMLDALLGRDVFLVAGCALAGAALIAFGNLLADLLRAAADPRVAGHL
jgi:peptide/nickel transport system permease protein